VEESTAVRIETVKG